MSKLNLAASNKQEELVLAYLQKNASETLANKINNGVYIEKDGKRLLNKKDLKGFMRFACEEARKLAEKGANSACVEDNVVYGWAVHYFEENSIVGTLYNDDGTEYKKVVAKPTTKSTVTTKPVITQKKPSSGQVSIFDMNFDEITSSELTSEICETEYTKPLAIDEAEEINETAPPTTEQEEKFFDEFESNVRMLNDVEETENDEIPPSGTVQATAVETPKPKVTEQYSQPKQKTSPAELLYYKYEIMQKQYPDHILFYRLGDFYEAFGKSAELASDVLDLTLTGKNCGSLGRIPMCGLPYHVIEVYVEKLRKYYGVVLMHSDTELQKHPKKDCANTVQESPQKENVPNHEPTVVANKKTNDETNDSPKIEHFNNIDDYTNKETGEITLPKIDKELFDILYKLLDGQIIMG